MQINSSLSLQSEIVRDVPARVLASLAEGKQVQATVVARLSAEIIQIRLGDKLIQLNSSLPVQTGQQVQLERAVENGQPVLRITPAAIEQPLLAAVLRQGQQVAVEVIKLLADNRLLLTPSLLNADRHSVNNNPQQQAALRLPVQIEVDISKLPQQFRVGDKLVLEVLKEQPLAVQLKTSSASRAELIQTYQRELLPQINRTPPNYSLLQQLKPDIPITEPVRQGISQFLQAVVERQSLQQAEGVKQALSNSGLFLENRLTQTAPKSLVTQDLKANLLQLAQVLKTELAQPQIPRLIEKPELLQKLPADVQVAVRQLLVQPQLLRTLPAQVPPALASQGQTPMQLLLSLLSGMATSLPSQPQQSPEVAGAQSAMPRREMPINASTAQPALRAMEWQVLRDLLREVESVSARLQFNQLSMLRDPDSPSNVNVWLFDMPIKDKQQLDSLQLRLEQHSPALTDEDEAIWQVQLNLETQNLGPMQARISLHKDDVKVVLLAEREESAALLSTHIDALNQRLIKLGVNVSHLSSRQAPIQPLSPISTEFEPSSSHLVDISV